MPNGRSKYSYSRATYGPIKSSAYKLEIALKLLLEILEKDSGGVQELAKKADAHIAVNRDLYIGSDMGFQISNDTLSRISELNLNIEFEQYVSGNPLQEEE